MLWILETESIFPLRLNKPKLSLCFPPSAEEKELAVNFHLLRASRGEPLFAFAKGGD